jgi:uncharacterized protein YlzI (FlbEa/FlbD family)
MPLINLTRPDGSKVELNPDTISSIKPALPNVYVKGVKSVVRDDGEDFAVTESIMEINAILKAIGR